MPEQTSSTVGSMQPKPSIHLSTFDIAKMTMPWILLRSAAYVGIVIIFTIYIGLVAGVVAVINNVTGPSSIGVIVGAVLLFGALGIWRLIKSYVLYLAKAGHIATVSEIVAKGGLPAGVNQITFGTEKVKKFFKTSSAMFAVDLLMSQAVKEIQKGINQIGEWLNFIPGMEAVTGAFDLFVGLLLGYADEAVLGYIFEEDQGNVWKTAADGLVLYAQNWKDMIKAAGMLTLALILALAAAGGIGFGAFSLAGALNLNAYIVVGIVVVLFLLIKSIFIDPIVMIDMVSKYLETSLGETPSVDLYGKISGISKKFRKIAENGGVSTPVAASATTGIGLGALGAMAGGMMNNQSTQESQPMMQSEVGAPPTERPAVAVAEVKPPAEAQVEVTPAEPVEVEPEAKADVPAAVETVADTSINSSDDNTDTGGE